MAKAKFVVDDEKRFCMVRIQCPGCGDSHMMPVNPVPEGYVESPHYANGSHWGWNGSVESPTFTPSILARAGHYRETPEVAGNCYCDYHERYPDAEPVPKGWGCYRCHSFVTDGKIQFLSDCTHALAGQTVELPDIESPL